MMNDQDTPMLCHVWARDVWNERMAMEVELVWKMENVMRNGDGMGMEMDEEMSRDRTMRKSCGERRKYKINSGSETPLTPRISLYEVMRRCKRLPPQSREGNGQESLLNSRE